MIVDGPKYSLCETDRYMYILSNQTDLIKFIIIHRKVVKVQESKLQSLGIKEYHREK